MLSQHNCKTRVGIMYKNEKQQIYYFSFGLRMIFFFFFFFFWLICKIIKTAVDFWLHYSLDFWSHYALEGGSLIFLIWRKVGNWFIF